MTNIGIIAAGSFLPSKVLSNKELPGGASRDDIETAIKCGIDYPIGHLVLADHIGLDVLLTILQSIYLNCKELSYNPDDLWFQLATDGKLGKKSRDGFCAYKEPEK